MDQTMRLELISTFEQELAQLARTQQELYSTYRAHQVATVMMRKEFTRPLVLIRKAGPDLSFDPFLAAIGRVALFERHPSGCSRFSSSCGSRTDRS